MPTTKQRINLSVTPEMGSALEELADRDQTSVSTKALDLLRIALEIEEDRIFTDMVKAREKVKGKFISHDEAWV